MHKTLLILASALVSANALNIADAFTEGSCIVYSTTYAVISSKEDTETVLSSASTIESSSSAIPQQTSIASDCPLDLPFSCSNTTSMDLDLCCFEYPGGVVLQTQFWDYNPFTGPADSFTIHGLWPDNCDGTYSQYCDTAMEITDPASIVRGYDLELLEYMQEYWRDYTGDDESLWEHEFNKHGTCYSTLKSSCYDNMTQYQNVYDYYAQTVKMFKELPTYQWLADAGIVPSDTVTYSKTDFIAALTNEFGGTPYISCDSSNAIQEVWYMYHVKGPVVGGEYSPIDTLTTSGCSDQIKFPPKQLDTAPSSTHTTDDPLATAITTKGYVYLENETGCLIKNGKWYATGTCATYSMIPLSTGSVYLESSAGYCTIDNSVFTCSADVTAPFEFNFDPSTRKISANGQTTFSAAEVAKGQVQEVVSLGAGAVEFTLQFTALS